MSANSLAQNVKAEHQFPPEHIYNKQIKKNSTKSQTLKADRSSYLQNGYIIQHFTEPLQAQTERTKTKLTSDVKCMARLKGKTIFFYLFFFYLSLPFSNFWTFSAKASTWNEFVYLGAIVSMHVNLNFDELITLTILHLYCKPE